MTMVPPYSRNLLCKMILNIILLESQLVNSNLKDVFILVLLKPLLYLHLLVKSLKNLKASTTKATVN